MIPPPGFRLPESAHVGAVTLQVADLDRSLAFYRDLVGYHLIDRHASAPRAARLGAPGSDVALLELRERPGARPVPRRGLLGLYHFALLLPDRPSLGRFLRHLQANEVHAGAADHVFSEALYLTDPDGLQMEVYRDLPRDQWQSRDGELVSGVDPIDARGLLQAAGTVPWAGVPSGSIIGHVHLYVGDLAAGEAFYHAGLGLDKTISTFPGALFLSAGGYHHHIAVNTWAAGAPVATDADARLLHWDLIVPDRTAIAAARDSLQHAGAIVEADGDAVRAVDPWSITVRIVAAAR
jgi:catechol 2,3-dioxygenase